MSLEDDLAALVEGLSETEIADVVRDLPPDLVEKLVSGSGNGVDVKKYKSPLRLAQGLDSKFAVRPHLVYLSNRLARAVRDVEAGQSRRLVISMPPRSGKSLLVSQFTPLWILARHPDWNTILTSNESTLTESWSRNILRMIREHPELGIELGAKTTASEWETTAGARVLARGVNGSLTGSGARCFVGSTEIMTRLGPLSMEEAYNQEIDHVLAYDHQQQRPVWKRVEGHLRTRGRRVVEVHTEAGRVLTCTPDHPIYTSRGYVPAGSLRGGEALLSVDSFNDTVAMVVDRGQTADVYDIQVADTHNFFADGVLVHNCMFIDDPAKSFQDSHSPAATRAVWDWFLSVASTRLEPPSLLIVCATRWSGLDLISRLLSEDSDGDPDEWENIAIPAVAGPGDLLGRSPGEPLLSPLLDQTPEEAEEHWDKVRSQVGTYVWNSLFQQNPTPQADAIFNPSWIRYWTLDPEVARANPDVQLLTVNDLTRADWTDSWDCAFKGSESSDWVVGQRWARLHDGRYVLVAQQRGKWDFNATLQAFRRWSGNGGPDNGVSPFGDWVHRSLVEDAANGPAIVSSLKGENRTLVPIRARDSKEGRARAAAPLVEDGRVLLPFPGEAPWVNELVDELVMFPHGRHDDQCLVAGTRVETPAGPVPIESVSAGDTVLGASGWVTVEAAGQTGVSRVVRVAGLECTPGHPVWTDGRGWVSARDLVYSDRLWTLEGARNMATNEPTTARTAGRSSVVRESAASSALSPNDAPSRFATVLNAAQSFPERAKAICAMLVGSAGKMSESRKSNHTGSCSGDIRTPITPLIADTTSQTGSISKTASTLYTERCTKGRSVLFRTGTKLTTKISTLVTTTRQTLRRCLAQSTGRGQGPNGRRAGARGETSRLLRLTWTKSVHSPKNGTPVRKVELGTENTPTDLSLNPVPVYNLKTSDGTFYANEVLTHNCDALTQALNWLREHGTSAGAGRIGSPVRGRVPGRAGYTRSINPMR